MAVKGDQLLSLLQAGDQVDHVAGSSIVGGHMVVPSPGFVVKTRDETGRKVFMNVCSSPLFPLPPSWPSTSSTTLPLPPDVIAYLTPGPHQLSAASIERAEQALAFGVFLSSPRNDADHSGNPAITLEALFNPEALRVAAECRPFKMFLIQLTLGEAEKALGVQLDPQFKLPKMKNRGTVPAVPLPEQLRTSLEQQRGDEIRQQNAEEIKELRLPGSSSTSSMHKNSGTASGGSSVLIREIGKATQGSAGSNPTAPSSISMQPAKDVLLQEQLQGRGKAAKSAEAALPKQALRPVSVKYKGCPAETAVVTIPLPRSIIETEGLDDNPNRIKIEIRWDCVDVFVPGYAPVTVQLPFGVGAESSGSLPGEENGRVVVSEGKEGGRVRDISANCFNNRKSASAVLSVEKESLELRLPLVSFSELKNTWLRKN